jgi:hypothetical protein
MIANNGINEIQHKVQLCKQHNGAEIKDQQ